MEEFSWIHTWAAQVFFLVVQIVQKAFSHNIVIFKFNSNDTRLMVTGVLSEVNGEVAVFSTGKKVFDFFCNFFISNLILRIF
jgi:hypothetical protein